MNFEVEIINSKLIEEQNEYFDRILFELLLEHGENGF
jgi:hypothetical protein